MATLLRIKKPLVSSHDLYPWEQHKPKAVSWKTPSTQTLHHREGRFERQSRRGTAGNYGFGVAVWAAHLEWVQ